MSGKLTAAVARPGTSRKPYIPLHKEMGKRYDDELEKGRQARIAAAKKKKAIPGVAKIPSIIKQR